MLQFEVDFLIECLALNLDSSILLLAILEESANHHADKNNFANFILKIIQDKQFILVKRLQNVFPDATEAIANAHSLKRS